MQNRITKVMSLLEPAGEIFLRYLEKETAAIREKTKNDFVTQADEEIELYLTDSLLRSFPEDSVIQEEHGDVAGKSEYTWVIDPIDGTNNYARQIPDARIMVALLQQGKTVFGAIYNPLLQEVYMAEEGKGAERLQLDSGQKTKLEVSVIPLEKSLVIYTAGIASGEPKGKEIFDRLLGKIGAIRLYGSAAVAFELIASGRAESFVCNIAKPMDMAAGSLIVQEAGGKVSNFKGADWTLEMKEILVTNGTTHSDLLELVK